MHMYLFPGIVGFRSLDQKLLEVEVRVSSLSGHSGDSILWNKS